MGLVPDQGDASTGAQSHPKVAFYFGYVDIIDCRLLRITNAAGRKVLAAARFKPSGPGRYSHWRNFASGRPLQIFSLFGLLRFHLLIKF